MKDRVVVGTRPWLGFLNTWDWLTKAIPAERLAALRIGTGLVMLADVALTYWPFRYDYFGPGSLSSPDVFADHFQSPHWSWSVIRWLPSVFTPDAICAIWMIAALALTLGIYARGAACVCWIMAISVINSNAYLHNSGDLVRMHLLFALMLTPCGAAWSLAPPKGIPPGAKVAIYPWAIRLLFLELIVIYFFNGIYKVAFGSNWQSGTVLHYVLHTPGWARWSPPVSIPVWLSTELTYFVLAWELLFPVLVLVRPARIAALCIGAAFHIVTFFNLEIGPFGLYALCMYLPLLPWEGRPTPAQRDPLGYALAEALEVEYAS